MGIIKAKSEIDIAAISEHTQRIGMLCNNLRVVRLGLRNEDVILNENVVDDAIFVIEDEIEKLVEQIDSLLYERG